jgi:hypothetical protein
MMQVAMAAHDCTVMQLLYAPSLIWHHHNDQQMIMV